jgi:hypothetical protein
LDDINEFELVNNTLENKIKEIVESIDLWKLTILTEFSDMHGFIKSILYWIYYQIFFMHFLEHYPWFLCFLC